jgi:hypothetical protein
LLKILLYLKNYLPFFYKSEDIVLSVSDIYRTLWSLFISDIVTIIRHMAYLFKKINSNNNNTCRKILKISPTKSGDHIANSTNKSF